MKTKINSTTCQSIGHRISIQRNGEEAAHAYLWVLRNDIRKEPFGLMEDVHVELKYRSKGIGSGLVKQVVALAKRIKCYKLIATSRHSRPKVHKLYERLGFAKHGLEFRIDF